jgi:hypothetical protein
MVKRSVIKLLKTMFLSIYSTDYDLKYSRHRDSECQHSKLEVLAMKVHNRNLLLFSRREAARAGIALPSADSRAKYIREHLKANKGDIVRIGVVNGLKVC